MVKATVHVPNFHMCLHQDLEAGKGLFKILKGRRREKLGKVMGHSGLKTSSNSAALYSISWSYTATHSHTQVSESSIKAHTTHMDCHGTWEKKADHSSLLILIIKYDSLFM